MQHFTTVGRFLKYLKLSNLPCDSTYNKKKCNIVQSVCEYVLHTYKIPMLGIQNIPTFGNKLIPGKPSVFELLQ